ncbi:ABC transporter permease [Bacillus sp. B15-48]|uniref:ABC transporter permease n=1 Tax=Bacillus sp. B15-48 TaxID=1548601 RepID=UPI00193F67F4|nr:ABC transporter permease [Bacillus sp. B15-48]
MGRRKVFFQRMKEEWKFQSKVFATIFDWTVIVYLLLPGLLIFTFIYRSWWQDAPLWMTETPILFLFFLSYLFTWYGNYRTFIQEADKVFLIKHHQLFLGLKKTSFVYSFIVRAFLFGVVTLIFLPFFYHASFVSVAQCLAFYSLFTSLNWLLMTIKGKLRKIESKIMRVLASIVIFILGSWLVQFMYWLWASEAYLIMSIIIILLTFCAVIFHYPALKRISSFEEEWLLEQQERNKYIQLIFTAAPEIENIKVSTRTTPWIFRKSKRIFKSRNPKKGFIEIFIKIFIRNPTYILSFFQLISVTVAAVILIPPYWLKISIFCTFIIMVYSWTASVFDKITVSHPMTKKYGEMDAFFVARKKITLSLLTVAILAVFGAAVLGILFLPPGLLPR